MDKPIYLDYMATTPMDPRVFEAMVSCCSLAGAYGNPASSSHFYGWEAKDLVEKARKQVAELIHADPQEIVWTSGATESDNLALKGAAYFYKRNGNHIITMKTEHKAVLDTCRFLESEGFEVTYLSPQKNGIVDLNELKDAIRPTTILISIMHVNNETGVIQDIASIGKLAAEHGIKFHVDAAQSVGKVAINLKELNVDLMSFSAHKIYGPKGMGALYVRRSPRVRLVPLQHGGGHEQGMRSGTLPTQQIVAMGEAFAIAQCDFESDQQRISLLFKKLWAGISSLGGVHLNGDEVHRIAGCMNLYFEGVDGESLLAALRNIAVSSGSACNSANPEPSHVLLAMGLSRQDAYASLRISIGRFTTEEDVDKTIAHIKEQVNRLREASPIWEKVKKNISI